MSSFINGEEVSGVYSGMSAAETEACSEDIVDIWVRNLGRPTQNLVEVDMLLPVDGTRISSPKAELRLTNSFKPGKGQRIFVPNANMGQSFTAWHHLHLD